MINFGGKTHVYFYSSLPLLVLSCVIVKSEQCKLCILGTRLVVLNLDKDIESSFFSSVILILQGCQKAI